MAFMDFEMVFDNVYIDRTPFNIMDNYLLLIKGLINNIIVILYLYFKIFLLFIRIKGLTILKNICLIYLFLKKETLK